MKTKKYLLVCLGLIGLLAGCTSEYTIEDINNHVFEVLGHNNFTVNSQPIEVMGDDGYEDLHYTVKDNNQNIEFVVINDYYWASEALENRLIDNYDDTIKVLNMHSDFVFDNLEYKDGIVGGTYSNRQELEALIDEASKLLEFTAETKAMSFDFSFKYKHASMIIKSDLDYNRNVSNIDGNKKEEIISTYVVGSYMHGLKENLTEFTEEELKYYRDNYCSRVWREVNNGNKKVYNGLYTYKWGNNITPSILYDVLKSEGFNVDGTRHNYQVTGLNGKVYKFNYQYNTYVSQGEHGYSYYVNDELKLASKRDSYILDNLDFNQLLGFEIYSGYSE